MNHSTIKFFKSRHGVALHLSYILL